jgi:hypothetical protein
MADNLKGIPFSNDDEGKTFPETAKTLVWEQEVEAGVLDEHPEFSINDIYVVWFAYTLGNWKALCSTSIPDGRYFEVTYHAQRKVAFVDTYVKVANQEVEIS